MTLCNSIKERLFSHYALFHTQLINVFHYLQTLPLVTLLHFMSCHSIQIGCFLNVFFLIFHFYVATYLVIPLHHLITAKQWCHSAICYSLSCQAGWWMCHAPIACRRRPYCHIMSHPIPPLLLTSLCFASCPNLMISNVRHRAVKTAA